MSWGSMLQGISNTGYICLSLGGFLSNVLVLKISIFQWFHPTLGWKFATFQWSNIETIHPKCGKPPNNKPTIWGCLHHICGDDLEDGKHHGKHHGKTFKCSMGHQDFFWVQSPAKQAACPGQATQRPTSRSMEKWGRNQAWYDDDNG